MVRRTFEALQGEDGDGEFTTALTRYNRRDVQAEPKRRRTTETEEVEACCSCSRYSTCKTSRCSCHENGDPCRNCRCLHRCSNLMMSLRSQEGEQVCGETNEDDEDRTSRVPSDESYEYTALPPPLPQVANGSFSEDPSVSPSEEDPEEGGVEGEEELLRTQPPDPPELPGLQLNAVDQKIQAVYGDHVRQNDGTHLDGGIADDAIWQAHWREVISLPPQRYAAPNGRVGRLFLQGVTAEFQGIQSRKWNSERLIVFIAVILQRSPEAKRARDIRRRIEARLQEWSAGRFDMLVQDTVRTSKSLISRTRRQMTDEQISKTYTSLVLQGKLRQAVRFVTARDRGGILQGDDIDVKSGLPVKEVLASKHPDARTPDITALEEYDVVPDLVPLDITGDTVLAIAPKLQGAAGPGGVDAIALQHWLMRFGKESGELRDAVASFTRWLANDSPPWAAYRAFMSSRLIALDKCPGVRPVGIGDIWRRLFSKCVLALAGEQAKDACGSAQLCAGLEAGIDGAVHAVRALWDEHEEDDDWGFLLVDARNAFNEGNRYCLLWTVRHRWTAGARFAFNCYRHWSLLLVRGTEDAASFLHSQEGVTQGCVLAMLIYGIGMLPLTQLLQRELPACIQPWFADDAGAGGKFSNILQYFKRLQDEGPARGYFPEPTKSILVVQPRNVERAKATFAPLGFTIVTGARYLGGHVGTVESKNEYVKERVKLWEEGIISLSRIAKSSPQCAFVGLQKSLQSEWTHLQRVLADIGPAFAPVESAIRSHFIPALLDADSIGDSLRHILALPVKAAGIALPDPTATATHNHAASTAGTTVISAALLHRAEWNYPTHKVTMRAARLVAREEKLQRADDTITSLSPAMTPLQLRKITRARSTGAWISVLPSDVNGLSLSKLEYRDGMRMRYGLPPKNIPQRCDGCDGKFSVGHALACKKGGLVVMRHNEVRDEIAHLATLALSSSRVRDEPIINIGLHARETKFQNAQHVHSSSPSQPANTHSPPHQDGNFFDRGDLLIHGLFEKQTSCILDIRVTDTDSPSYLSSTPERCIRNQEKAKKKKYLEACLEQRRHFTPYVCDTNGLLGAEAEAVNKRLAGKLASKWRTPYSVTCGFVRARISVAILRATHLCLRGSRVPFRHASSKWSAWEDGAGLGLYREI